MSVGKIREDHDKLGDICKVVDAIMNPKVVELAKKETALQ